MITLFPELYPDELLYSAIARYHVRAGNIDSKNTLRDLYNKDTITAMIEMTSNLETLVNKLPYPVYTIDQLIKNNTMYSYFTSFMSGEKSNKIYECMKGDYGSKIYNYIGIGNKVMRLNRYLRFCPLCYEEDIKKYGETYWHRLHQVAELDYCIDHKCKLINSKVSVRSKNKQEFVNAHLELEKYNIEGLVGEQAAAPLIDNDDIKDKVYIVGEDILYLMENKLKHYELNYFRDIYIQRLLERGLADNREVYQDELLIRFKEYWGEEFLDLINCNFDISKTTNWVTTITRKHRKGFHPIQHILFIRFLGLDIRNIFEGTIKQNANYIKKDIYNKTIEEKEKYRDRWRILMQKYPDYSKTALREEDSSAYRWLYKYDTEWLNCNSPKKKVGKRKNSTIKWEERDKEILVKLINAVGELKGTTGKPIRITLTRLGKMINSETLLQRYLDELPLSKFFIKENVESIEQFQRRRIKWATKELENEDRVYSKWDILRKAGLTNM